jgi:glycine betaine/proline transport system substrate-binding protein
MSARALVNAVGALSIVALLGAPVAAQDSSDPIKLTLHDWTGQLVTTQIMGEVLKQAGYTIEYVPADYLAQFAGLKTGDLHVAMEVWATTGQEALTRPSPAAASRISARPACRRSRNGGTRPT